MAVDISRRRFTVADYERMIEAGILTEEDRVEVIAGENVEMAAIGIRHMNCINQVGKRIGRAIDDSLIVSIQNPIRLSNDGMPQPDIAVFPDHGIDAPMPVDTEVLLVVEVSDTSRNYDR